MHVTLPTFSSTAVSLLGHALPCLNFNEMNKIDARQHNENSGKQALANTRQKNNNETHAHFEEDRRQANPKTPESRAVDFSGGRGDFPDGGTFASHGRDKTRGLRSAVAVTLD